MFDELKDLKLTARGEKVVDLLKGLGELAAVLFCTFALIFVFALIVA